MSLKPSIQAFFSRLVGPLDPSIHASTSPGVDTPSVDPHHQNNGSSKPASRYKIRPPKPVYQRWWFWIVLASGASLVGTVVTTRHALQVVEEGLPGTDAVLTYTRNGTLTLKAEDGTILQQIGPATRERVQFEQIPVQLTQAFVAAEDKNFYEHDGVDYSAIARAIYQNVLAGEVVEGGSTITQQLARIVFLDQSRTLERKLREAMLAQKIEREMSKETILERYLNLVYLGSGAYGVADAAWIYFSKSVDQLTLAEMAMIAGLAPAPSAFSPLVDLDAALSRRDLTLERMLEAGFITPAQKDAAIAAPIELKPSLPKYFVSNTPYFTSYIQQELPKLVPQEEIELGGLTIETTLNLNWQTLAEEAIAKAINEYGPRQGFKQAALVSVDPKTGAIRAMVGGNDFGESQFNRVTQAQRQPGSTFKTFVYATAVAGGLSPYRSYEDNKFIVDGYEPKNYEDRYRGGSVSIRDALIASINVVAVKALIDVGFDPVINLAQRMGIQSELYPTYSLALGASEVNLLELTSAYGTLANQGKHIEPHGIVRILNRYNDVIYEANFAAEQAVDVDTAAIVTWMLQGVVQSGTGRRAQLGRDVAGKTGTSEERRDLWFVGFIPQVVTGVWLGNDDNQPTWGASTTAARTWHDFMAPVVEGMPVEEFPELPRLDGREATIELQPVKPRRMRDGGSSDNSEQDSSSEERYNNRESEAEPRGRNESESSGSAEDEGNPFADEAPEEEASDSSEPTQDASPTPSPSPAQPPASEDPSPPPVPAVPLTEPVAPTPMSQPSAPPSPAE